MLFAKACELFILELTLRAWAHTEDNKRRTLQRNDVANAISTTSVFDFLVEIVPLEETKAKSEGEGDAPGGGAGGLHGPGGMMMPVGGMMGGASPFGDAGMGGHGVYGDVASSAASASAFGMPPASSGVFGMQGGTAAPAHPGHAAAAAAGGHAATAAPAMPHETRPGESVPLPGADAANVSHYVQPEAAVDSATATAIGLHDSKPADTHHVQP